MSIAAIDLILGGDCEIPDCGKVGEALGEVTDDFGLPAGSPHDFANGLVYFLMLFNVMLNESNELKSEDFLLFDVLCLEQLEVGLRTFDDEFLQQP